MMPNKPMTASLPQLSNSAPITIGNVGRVTPTAVNTISMVPLPGSTQLQERNQISDKPKFKQIEDRYLGDPIAEDKDKAWKELVHSLIYTRDTSSKSPKLPKLPSYPGFEKSHKMIHGLMNTNML